MRNSYRPRHGAIRPARRCANRRPLHVAPEVALLVRDDALTRGVVRVPAPPTIEQLARSLGVTSEYVRRSGERYKRLVLGGYA